MKIVARKAHFASFSSSLHPIKMSIIFLSNLFDFFGEKMLYMVSKNSGSKSDLINMKNAIRVYGENSHICFNINNTMFRTPHSRFDTFKV